MSEKLSTTNGGNHLYVSWRKDRRRPQKLQPPPYRTVGGPVDIDRRTYLDRRSAWIRNYLIDLDDDDTM